MDELRFIPINTEDSDPGVFVQGTHVPARLVEESGVWIREAGSAILTQDQYQIAPFHHTLWLIADEGDMTMTFGAQRLRFKKGECFVIPAGTTDCPSGGSPGQPPSVVHGGRSAGHGVPAGR